MVTYKVYIPEINSAKEFCAICQSFDFDIDIIKDSQVIDAKSLLGLFSLDLSKPIVVRPVNAVDDAALSKFEEAIAKYRHV